MFKKGEKVKYIGIGRNYYGDTRSGEAEGILIPGCIYTVISYSPNVFGEGIGVVRLENGKHITWELATDCVKKMPAKQRNLPAWW